MKKIVLLVVVAICFGSFSCSWLDNSKSHDLKSSLDKSVDKINTAVSKISASDGYQIITGTDVTEKSTISYTDSITMDLIKGIYTYQPDTTHRCNHNSSYKLFKKTGVSDSLIINMPNKLAFHPYYMEEYDRQYTMLTNDFTIKASDYHCYYNWRGSFDYALKAALVLDSVDLGTMTVAQYANARDDQEYISSFSFTEGYAINTLYQVGDSIIKEFSLTKDTDTLLRESVLFIKNGTYHPERQYTLSIGNIDIKKTTGIDSIQVYLDGVLQKTAAATIVDSTDTSDPTICHYRRDILITFDDGTTVKLSELLDPVLEQLGDIVDSLRSMKFAKRVVDYVAFNIYYSRQWFYYDMH
jgi:hypothetical protein